MQSNMLDVNLHTFTARKLASADSVGREASAERVSVWVKES